MSSPKPRPERAGAEAVECVHPIRDLHVTLLRLLGLHDDELTFLHEGRSKQLSQVGGSIIEGLLAQGVGHRQPVRTSQRVVSESAPASGKGVGVTTLSSVAVEGMVERSIRVVSPSENPPMSQPVDPDRLPPEVRDLVLDALHKALGSSEPRRLVSPGSTTPGLFGPKKVAKAAAAFCIAAGQKLLAIAHEEAESYGKAGKTRPVRRVKITPQGMAFLFAHIPPSIWDQTIAAADSAHRDSAWDTAVACCKEETDPVRRESAWNAVVASCRGSLTALADGRRDLDDREDALFAVLKNLTAMTTQAIGEVA